MPQALPAGSPEAPQQEQVQERPVQRRRAAAVPVPRPEAPQEPPRGAVPVVVPPGAVFAPLPRLLQINMRSTAVRQLWTFSSVNSSTGHRPT